MVATPIGNLGDVTARALDTLRRADVVAAEDTRVTGAMLRHFGIGAKLVAVHAHNERKAAERVVAWIAERRSVALVSDAGTPGVSDPGAVIVAAVRDAGLAVIPVAGASALTAALSVSGLSYDGVVFAGFLPTKGRERKQRLAALAAGPWAIVLFEAPHRIVETLEDLHRTLGERTVVIARELTKRFETITRVELSQAARRFASGEEEQRGEFVLVIEACPGKLEAGGREAKEDPEAVLRVLLDELPLKQAVSLAAKLTGAKRNALYAAALALKR